MKALKIREMLRHGVRVCKVGLQPCPSAHGSAPSVSWSDAVPRFFNPARQGTVARLKQSLFTPIVAVATSETLLRCCPHKMQTPSPPHCHSRPEEALWLREGLCSHDPEPCWTPGLGPAPIPKTLGEMPHPETLPVPETLQGCDSNATPRAALLKASGGFKVLAASGLALSREKRCHLGLCPPPTRGLQGFFDGSDLSFEEKQMMFCNCCCRATPLPASAILS